MSLIYNIQRYPFMTSMGLHIPKTEEYVSCPPAAQIRVYHPKLDQYDVFTLGFELGGHRGGEYEYDVVVNGVKTDEMACRIELRSGKLRIFGNDGWRTWTGKTFI